MAATSVCVQTVASAFSIQSTSSNILGMNGANTFFRRLTERCEAQQGSFRKQRGQGSTPGRGIRCTSSV